MVNDEFASCFLFYTEPSLRPLRKKKLGSSLKLGDDVALVFGDSYEVCHSTFQPMFHCCGTDML